MRNAARGDIDLEPTNLSTIVDFKNMYISKLEDSTDLSPSSVRFFCMGKELKNELHIYSYDLFDDSVVQAMIIKAK